MRRSPETRTRVLLVDKPAGWTSFQVVRRLKPLLGRKVGHAGTLDPFATGLLVVLAGQATRISELVMAMPKEYRVTVQFGAVSTTQDPTGVIEPTGGRVTEAEVREQLAGFRGLIRQVVPLTSAVKVGGEPLYRRAHRGEECETPVREVTVHELALLEFRSDLQQAVIRARTSKGTYVRTLAHDLGVAVGVGGYAAELRRLRVGFMDVRDAVGPEQVGEVIAAADGAGAQRGPAAPRAGGRALLSLSDVLRDLPRYDVRDMEESRARHGNELRGAPSGLVRVYGEAGLLALYEGVAGVSRPRVVFSSPQD